MMVEPSWPATPSGSTFVFYSAADQHVHRLLSQGVCCTIR